MAEHVHKLRRHKYKNGTIVFFCALDCNFKIERELAVGLKSICNQCGDEFIMNEYTIKLAKPHCRGCGKTLVKKEGGKRSYVNKERLPTIAADVASSQTATLRERLGQVTGVVVTMPPKDDEDI